MKQEIYADPYGLDAWDQRHVSRCFVTIAIAQQWQAITGEKIPTEMPTASQYTRAGLPWFDYYGGDAEALKGSEALSSMKSVTAMAEAKGAAALEGNESVFPSVIRTIGSNGQNVVREAKF